MLPADETTEATGDPELPFFLGGAERAFRVGGGRILDDGRVEVSMTTGEWCTGPDALPSLGSLGVLIDDTVGYPVVLTRDKGHWVTSQEIHVEAISTPPADGSVITGYGSLTTRDAHSGLASGVVQDDRGRHIAMITQRLRQIPGTPDEEGHDATHSAVFNPGDGDVLSQLRAELEVTAEGARLTVPLGPPARNPMGTLHGGILLCGSEVAGKHALTHDQRGALMTSSVKINYLRPGPVSGDIVFEARRVQRGRSVAVAEVTSRTPTGKLCTRATVTAHLP